MSEVIVVATIRAKEGSEGEVERGLRALVAPTHEEPGCVRYAIHRGVDDPTRFAIVERWRSREDLDAHFAQPHVRDMPDPTELLAEPPQVLFMEALEEGDAEKGRI